jgi:excisionase family DNA binding protein
MTDRLLTAREVAERWGISADTVLDRWQAGEIPGLRLFGAKGGPVRFRESEIAALEESWHRERAA